MHADFTTFWGTDAPADMQRYGAFEDPSATIFLPREATLLAAKNVFEAAILSARRDENLFVQSQQLFLGAAYICDEPDRGDAYFAHVPPDGLSTRVTVWHHDDHLFTDATHEDLDAFKAGDDTPRKPPVERSSLASLDVRCAWIHPVLCEGRFDAHRYEPSQGGYQMAATAEAKLATFVPSGMYWLWRSFLFGDRPTCERVLQKLLSSRSRLMRDAATTVKELLDGRRDLFGVDLGAAIAAIAKRPAPPPPASAALPVAAKVASGLPKLALSPSTEPRPSPPGACAAEIAARAALYRGPTVKGRVVITTQARTFVFAPGAAHCAPAPGLPEGRTCVVDVHPSRERCLLEVGVYMEHALWELDLESGKARILVSEKGASGAYAGEKHLVTAQKQIITLWALDDAGPKQLAALDTGVVAPVRGLGGTAIVCQSGVAGGMVLRLSQDTLEPLGTIAAGYDVPFASKGALFFAPTDPAEPVRSLAL
ncbi:MAG: hypothetical protein IT381_04180 [Deltaproteobacteria bacterium]|nr:hypothetical protein [Deltaproteobacteria bacterium]